MTKRQYIILFCTLFIPILNDSFFAHIDFLGQIEWILIWVFFISLIEGYAISITVLAMIILLSEFSRSTSIGAFSIPLVFFWLWLDVGLRQFFSQMTLIGATALYGLGFIFFRILSYLSAIGLNFVFNNNLEIKIGNYFGIEVIFSLILNLILVSFIYLILSKIFHLFNFSRIKRVL